MLTRDHPSSITCLYENSSLHVDFPCQEILLDRLIVLRDRIVVDNLQPRAFEGGDLFLSR